MGGANCTQVEVGESVKGRPYKPAKIRLVFTQLNVRFICVIHENRNRKHYFVAMKGQKKIYGEVNEKKISTNLEYGQQGNNK